MLPELFERRRGRPIRGNDPGDDPLPPFMIGHSGHGDVGDTGV
jgi:hypothetical protein